MIFADKLTQLRKKSGWSQEDLANQMGVSRQSVSKWEGAQSIPDLDKMIKLSKMFGVSIDYLLKDEIEDAGEINLAEDYDENFYRKVSLKEAYEFLQVKEATAKPIAYGVFLCILSPICLMLLGAISETPNSRISENVAGGIGVIVLLIFVAIAVAIFISCGSKTSRFEYLENEYFETEYGVTGMIKEMKEQNKSTYTRNNIIGVMICILSVIPLFAAITIDENNELFMVEMLCVMLVLIGIGVIFFVKTGVIWESYSKLLQEGEYSKRRKERKSIISAIISAYWLSVVAIYLVISFLTNQWESTWIVYAVAAVWFPAMLAIVNAFCDRKKKN